MSDAPGPMGWIPPDERNPEMNAAHAEAIAEMPRFAIAGDSPTENETQVFIWECWKHPDVVRSVGFEYPGVHQITGSCVGAGGGNTVFSLSAVEVVRLHDPEQALIPFWLIPYGRSRFYAGMRGRGEGSLGSAFAKAIRIDGVVPATLPELPKFNNEDGLIWGKSVELQWSAGDQISEDWLTKSRKHLVQSTAELQSADDVRAAIKNYFPCSIASNWGGKMKCPVTGNPPVLLNSRSGSWAHQMSVHGWMDHPELDELFYVMNQWGQDAHGRCPTGAPPGGFWIKKAEMDSICRNGEVYAFSQFAGFPTVEPQFIDWLKYT